MPKQNRWAAWLIFAPFALAAAGCGAAVDEAATDDAELDRLLELALERDTLPTTFEDGALPEPPAAQPAAFVPSPRPQQQAPRTQPQPASQPQREQPRPAPAPQPRVEILTVPTGTTMAIRLDGAISTEYSQAGQAFTATVPDPIISADGRVLIPTGAKVRGRITAVEPSNRIGQTAMIKLAFETVSFDGRVYPLQATIVEARPERSHRTGAGEQAAKIAAGAAAGAVLGQVFGRDRESTVRGAVIGAAAGTAIAMGTADVDAVLPAGSRMVIRLDSPVRIERVS